MFLALCGTRNNGITVQTELYFALLYLSKDIKRRQYFAQKCSVGYCVFVLLNDFIAIRCLAAAGLAAFITYVSQDAFSFLRS